MEEHQNDQKNKKVIQIPTWVASTILCIFFALILIILYLQLIRYKLVSKTIDAKDTITSALLLSPEIATGLARLL